MEPKQIKEIDQENPIQKKKNKKKMIDMKLSRTLQRVKKMDRDGESKKKKKKKKKMMKRLKTDQEVKSLGTVDETQKKKKRLRRETTEEDMSGENEEVKKKRKRRKTKTTEEDVKIIPEAEASKQKSLFQRLFSEADELALLQGIIDFNSTSGDPFKDTDAFYGFAASRICFAATKTQLVNKVRKMKQKFLDTVKKSLDKGKGGEKEIVFSKDFEQKAFELSRKIWGIEGVLPSKPRSPKDEPDITEKNVASSPLSSGEKIVALFKEFNLLRFASDESSLLGRWSMVPGPLKRALEAKLKMQADKQVEVCLDRIDLLAYAADVILRGDNASSSGVEEEKDVSAEQLESNERD